ncbi:hypothetical protein HN51_036674 [Arachis hypogaea]
MPTSVSDSFASNHRKNPPKAIPRALRTQRACLEGSRSFGKGRLLGLPSALGWEMDFTLVKVFAQMKKAQVEPNKISYCILAIAHAVARLYTATEAYVQAVKKSVIGNNWSTFDVLLILYGYLGSPEELERVWGIIQELPLVR